MLTAVSVVHPHTFTALPFDFNTFETGRESGESLLYEDMEDKNLDNTFQ
jgi:hypothetical protein